MRVKELDAHHAGNNIVLMRLNANAKSKQALGVYPIPRDSWDCRPRS